jgi:hypothetical protein
VKENGDLVRGAPHTPRIGRMDEIKAVHQPTLAGGRSRRLRRFIPPGGNDLTG